MIRVCLFALALGLVCLSDGLGATPPPASSGVMRLEVPDQGLDQAAEYQPNNTGGSLPVLYRKVSRSLPVDDPGGSRTRTYWQPLALSATFTRDPTVPRRVHRPDRFTLSKRGTTGLNYDYQIEYATSGVLRADLIKYFHENGTPDSYVGWTLDPDDYTLRLAGSDNKHTGDLFEAYVGTGVTLREGPSVRSNVPEYRGRSWGFGGYVTRGDNPSDPWIMHYRPGGFGSMILFGLVGIQQGEVSQHQAYSRSRLGSGYALEYLGQVGITQSGGTYVTETTPLSPAGAGQTLATLDWQDVGEFTLGPDPTAHYAFSPDNASASKLHYKLGLAPGPARAIMWLETFTPDGATAPAHYRMRTEQIADGATETQEYLLDPFAWRGTEAGSYRVVPFDAQLAVDANRNAVIKLASEDASDATSPAQPYRFWLNDDNDMDGAEGLNESGGNDIPGQTQNFYSSDNESRGIGADYSTSAEGTGFVDGVRDLIDFFPVYLDLKQLLTVLPTTTPGVKYKLKQADGALNFVYTNKTRGQAFDYQRQLLTTGFSDLFDKQPGEAITHRITAEGYELSAAFLTGIKDSDWGVLLVEGRAATTAPLVLVVEKDGTAFAEVKLEIKISPVEQMFRHVNLTGNATNYNGSALTLPASVQPTATAEPAGWPDSQTNGKYFVFVHGYNVDGQKARGWNCEVFKRMHVLDSKARFVGVTWHGATGLDYHKAVYQAFQTGDAINAALNFTGSADVTIAAHSLGNMVVSHAIQSGGYSPSRYYLINAAVPIEAYDLANVDTAQRTAMVEDDWKSRDARFYAANWHQLFSATPADRRNELSWKNRFRDVPAKAFNFYSSGEDVVANVPETDTAAVGATLLNQGFNFTRGAWKAQELVKGVNWTTSLAAAFMERGQGGWDSDLAYLFTSHASITNEQLKTRPFFDEFKEDDLINADPAIASAKAGETKVHYDLLARGLPALSYAAAANRLSVLDEVPPSRNFDMEAEGRTQNQWPSEGHTSSTTQNRWLHSDFKNAALPYVYQMYEAMIAKGSLK
jgi:hypothetical protein